MRTCCADALCNLIFTNPYNIFFRIRAIDSDIKEKNTKIETIDSESKDLKDRMVVMVEHLKNVQQELTNTQQLLEAKTKEVIYLQLSHRPQRRIVA